MLRSIVHVHYYDEHNTISTDKHMAVHIEKNKNYVEIVAEKVENDETNYYRHTYPWTTVIKIVEDI